MTCHKCQQGRECRKVRANGPPPADLPIQPSETESRRDRLEVIASYAAMVLALFFSAVAGALLMAAFYPV